MNTLRSFQYVNNGMFSKTAPDDQKHQSHTQYSTFEETNEKIISTIYSSLFTITKARKHNNSTEKNRTT